MSEYSTTKSIQGYYIGVDFSKSDYVTKSQVRSWVVEYSIKIDNVLRRKYTIPITNSNDLILLKLLVEKFVVGKIDGIMRVSTSDEDKKYLRNRNYTKDAESMLLEIKTGVLLLETTVKSIAPIRYNQGTY